MHNKLFGIGGRLAKGAVGVMTFAPTLGLFGKLLTSASVLGLGAITVGGLFAAVSNAQSACTWSNDAGTCQGSVTGNETLLSTSGNNNKTVTLSSNFTLNRSGSSSNDHGLVIGKEGGSNSNHGGNLTITQAGTASDDFAISTPGRAVDLKSNITGSFTGTVSLTLIRGIKSTRSIAFHTDAPDGTINVSLRNVSGRYEGIRAKHHGDTNGQHMTISATGSVHSERADGVNVEKTTSGNLTVHVADVTSNGQTSTTNTRGMLINRSGGSGNTQIRATGTVKGGRLGFEAHLNNREGGTTTINLSGVTWGTGNGSRGGVHIHTKIGLTFSASQTISARGTRNDNGNTYGHDGFYLRRTDKSATGLIKITVSAVNATGDGIHILDPDESNSVTTSIEITATDHVQGTRRETSDGIFIKKFGKGDVTISAEQVTGGRDGIQAHKYDEGSLSITVSGDVVGHCGEFTQNNVPTCRGFDDAGIWTKTDDDSDALSIDVTSAGSAKGSYGIYAYHEGAGKLTITAAGEIEGDGNDGIKVHNYGANTINNEPGVKITAKDIDTAHDGIYVKNDSRGQGGVDISISQSATITADEHGIYVYNIDRGNVKIALGASASVLGENIAIGVVQSGSGNVTINASAGSTITSFSTTTVGGSTVTEGNRGVYVNNASGGGTITANISSNIKAAGDGIFVINKANTTTTISTNGTISGAEVSGHGIYVNNIGSGNVSITVSGNITGGGTRNGRTVPEGRRTSNVYRLRTTQSGRPYLLPGYSILVTVIPARVIPARVGYALNLNSTTSGDKKSGTGTVTVTINSGTISAYNRVPLLPNKADGPGGAIKNGDGNSTITFNGANTGLNGKVNLGKGQDVLVFSGTTITAGTELDGGQEDSNSTDTDTLTFRNGAKTSDTFLSLDPAKVINWERINLNDNTNWRILGTKTLTADNVSIAGTISLSEAAAGSRAPDDRLTISGNVIGGGTIVLDVNLATGAADTITVTGNVTGATTLTINNVTPSNNTTRVTSDITVVTVNGTVSQGAFTSSTVPESSTYTLLFRPLSKTFVIGLARLPLCTTSQGGTAGTFVCAGTLNAPETMIASGTTNIVATLNSSSTTVASNAPGVIFTLRGQNGITFTQQTGGGTLAATGNASGILDASTTGNGNVRITLVGSASLAGSGTAVKVSSTGTGTISVSTNNVTANHSQAMAIKMDGAGTNVLLDAKGIIAGGIEVKNTHATGPVTVSASGAVSNNSGTPIYAYGKGSKVTVNASSTVTGSATGNNAVGGIKVVNKSSGSGEIDLTVSGTVTASGGIGIHAENDGSGALTITAAAVSATNNTPINVISRNSGDITLNVTGAVTGGTSSTSGSGIMVGGNGGGNISVNTVSVTGGVNGIDIRKAGSGRTSVIANGAISGSGSGDKNAGIFLHNDGSGGSIVVSVGSNGTLNGHNGIVIEDEGGSFVRLESSGAITGVRGDGINITKSKLGSITLNVTEVTGKKHGLKINHTAIGAVTATATRMVKTSSTSESYSGVEVSASGGAIGLSLAGATGTKHGVEAKTNGAGSITIVTSDAITGRTDGIRAFAEGQGNVSLTVSGTISAGTQGVGINTKASSGTTTIVINSGEIGGRTAIKNLAGASVITVNNAAEFKGNVELGAGVDQLTINSSKFNSDVRLDGGEDPSTDSSVDILTFSSGNSTAVAANLRNWERITVATGATLKFNTTNTVTSEEFRILGTLSLSDNAANDSLTVTGNLTTVGTGVTGRIEIDTNFATGATDTITVQQSMTGRKTLVITDVTPTNTQTRFLQPIKVVTVVGTTTANALTLNGTRFRTGGYVYTLSFDATSKSFMLRGERGILRCASSNNSGSFNCSGAINNPESIIASGNENLSASLARSATVSVSADVAITVSGRAAVSFTQEANGGTLNGTGGATGVIKASTTGNGAVSVQLTGTANLAGAGTAVEATSTGTGNVTVTATNVVASNVAAIAIKAEGRGRQVNVNVGTASGGRNAVMARNTGANGSIVIAATGTISGNTAAIDAASTNGNITINAVAVAGRIIAKNAGGRGNVSVTTTGNLTGSGSAAVLTENLGRGSVTVNASATVTGNGTDAIHILAGSRATSLNLTANSVSGVRNAIRATNQGIGATTIVLNGAVQTRNSSAVHVENSSSGPINITIAGAITGGSQGAAIDTVTDGGTTNITLNSGTTISATSGVAIRNDEGASVVNVNAGASISGTVRLGAGVDTLTFAEPTFGTSILDGGVDSGNTQPEDILTINGGTISAAMTDERWLNWEKIVIGNQATVSFSGSDNHVDATDLDLKGTVSLQNSNVQDGVTFRSNLVGGGTIKLDANFYTGSADLVNILNNVTGTTKLDIRDISTQTGGEEDEAIVIVIVSGTASATAFEIMSNPQASGAYDYELIFNSTDTTFSVKRKQAAGSVMLVAAPIALFDGFARAPSLYERRTVTSNEPTWGRVFTRSNGYGNAREGSSKYESSNTGFQFGYDIATSTNELGTIVYGATVQYNIVDADINAFNVPGTLSAKGFGIGGTATLYMEDGTYFDGQIQFNSISSDLEASNNIGTLIDGHDSTAFLLSAEAGRRYVIDDEYTLLYNGQLILGSVDSGNAKTPRGQAIDFGGDSGVTLRGGVRLEYLNGDNHFYGLANIYIDSMDSWDVTFAGETYSDSKSSTLIEIGGGGDVKLSPQASLFAHLAYKTSLKGGVDKRDSTQLSTGIRWSW